LNGFDGRLDAPLPGNPFIELAEVGNLCEAGGLRHKTNLIGEADLGMAAVERISFCHA
jgi:hypothetical protein